MSGGPVLSEGLTSGRGVSGSAPGDTLPVLTEVVVPSKEAGADGPPPGVPLPVLVHEVEMPAPAPVPASASAPIEAMPEDPLLALGRQETERVVHQVLTQLSGQIDRMFEFRVREALTPVLDKVVSEVVLQARDELGRVMADVVRRAVSQELSRRRAK